MTNQLSPLKIRSTLPRPDRFVFDEETETFYDQTPFGMKKVNHLNDFYNNLKLKIKSQNFSEMIVALCVE